MQPVESPLRWLRGKFLPIAALAELYADFTRFSSFTARAEIARGVTPDGDCVDLWALFTLGAGNDGIEPRIEPVKLSVGRPEWVISPGSFFEEAPGQYKAEVLIGETLIEMVIKTLRANEFELRASVAHVGFYDSANPVTISLTIGNDGGKTTVLADIWPCLHACSLL